MNKNEAKYKRIVNHVTRGIQKGMYGEGDRIPSINDFIKEYQLSRDTVFAGLSELRSKGIIDSNPGVGYYIASTRIEQKHRVFLLFNELNIFKEDLYNSFIESMGENSTMDIFFHSYNRKVFENLINEARGKYTAYVLMPGKFHGIEGILENLKGKVYLLDHIHPELIGKYPAVYQNFEKDSYRALQSGLTHLRKYRHIVMVQKDEKEPVERVYGVQSFCEAYHFRFEYLMSMNDRELKPGELYMVVNDRDLVSLIKKAEQQKLVSGKDIGIISYNDTALKEILYGGITTLSTDFRLMGKNMASLLKTKENEVIENPYKLIIRKSL